MCWAAHLATRASAAWRIGAGDCGGAKAAIIAKLKEEAGKLIAGDGRDPKSSLGPVISHAACERIHDAIESESKKERSYWWMAVTRKTLPRA